MFFFLKNITTHGFKNLVKNEIVKNACLSPQKCACKSCQQRQQEEQQQQQTEKKRVQNEKKEKELEAKKKESEAKKRESEAKKKESEQRKETKKREKEAEKKEKQRKEKEKESQRKESKIDDSTKVYPQRTWIDIVNHPHINNDIKEKAINFINDRIAFYHILHSYNKTYLTQKG